LWEATERLGGMLGIGGLVDPLLDRYLGWLLREVERAGVTMEVGRRATAALIHASGADVVVIATGALWGVPPELSRNPGADVRSLPGLRSWLEGGDAIDVGQAVAVLGGGKAGLSVAAALSRRGRAVTVIESTAVFGLELGLPGRWRTVADLEAAGVSLVGNAIVESVDVGRLRLTVDGEAEELKADTVIVAGGARPEQTLAEELRAAGVTVHAVGDCTGIGMLEGANLGAAELALALG
jgi:NADPH-dependent 2,4-dienoyl-CoA reductase/sulfur reductase-like enzyme